MTASTNALPVVAPAEGINGPPQGQWTYADYAALPDDGKRYELIKGVLYVAPSPTFSHQASNGRFFHYLFTHVELAGLGRVIAAPFDVELIPDTAAVQPDVLVVLNAHLDRITESKLIGAPDLVVEVASPSTAGYDRRNKQDAYAEAGVTEYWIADPASRSVEVLILQGQAYRSLGLFQGQLTLPSKIVPNLPVQVQQFFG
jgi:Uma2 family endonuclease